MIDEAKVIEILDGIRPMLQADGGDLEFVSIEDDNIVKVRLKGACAGCPGARMTLKNGVEARLQEVIPEVVAVEAVDFD